MGHTRDFTLKSGAVVHARLSDAWENSSELPILCLSGFGCSHYNFLEIEKRLGADFPMVLVDNRGMGKSSPASTEYTLKEVAFDALEVMEQLEVPKFHLAGISMGGFLAQLIAFNAPEKLESLLLLCTTSGNGSFIALPEMTEESLKAFYQIEEPKRTELAVMGTVHPSVPTEKPDLFKHICSVRREHPVDPEQVLRQKRAVDKFLVECWPLGNIHTPTLILTGAEDRFVNPKNAEILNEKIPHSQMEVIPECDHFFFMEKPDEVSEAMRKFLKGDRS